MRCAGRGLRRGWSVRSRPEMTPPRSPGPSRPGTNLGDDEIVRDWSLSAQDIVEVMRARDTEHRLRYAVQLCALRATGRFVSDYQRVPIEAISYLARQLGLTPVLFLSAAEPPETETAQAARIREYLGYREFDGETESRLRKSLATNGDGRCHARAIARFGWRAPAILAGRAARAEHAGRLGRFGGRPGKFKISLKTSWRDCPKVSEMRSMT